MDERILTETFDKITKQYVAIQDIFNSTNKITKNRINNDKKAHFCNKWASK